MTKYLKLTVYYWVGPEYKKAQAIFNTELSMTLNAVDNGVDDGMVCISQDNGDHFISRKTADKLCEILGVEEIEEETKSAYLLNAKSLTNYYKSS